MTKVPLKHSYKIYLPLAILFVILASILPRTGKFNYDYKKGSPWMYETLIAQFDFPIIKSDAQLQNEREEVGSNVIPYFKYSDDVAPEQLRILEGLNLGKYDYVMPKFINAFSRIYEKGVLSEAATAMIAETEGLDNNVIFIQKDRRAQKVPASEVYSLKEARTALVDMVQSSERNADIDSICSHSGITELLKPNLLFDRQTTELVHDESVNYISPTSGVINAGQLIVSNGEMVTAEIEQLLDSYKFEYENSLGYNGPRWLLWLGNFLLAFGLVTILYFAIYYTNYRIFDSPNKFYYLLVMFLLATVAALSMEKAGPNMIYLVPFTLIALFLLAFFKKRVVMPVYIISLLPLLIFTHNGVELFIMYLIAGIVSIYIFGLFNKGWQQFITAIITFSILLVTFLSFRLIDGIKGFNDYQSILFLFIGSLLSVAGYPLIYLFEKIFMLVSNSRLIELSDTNNKLLRDLAHKAPGTFQHSLQVMNIADAAARSIDANVLLVRAGALYHDIGKMANPQCFIENETLGTRYHEGLSPRESAVEITRHVPDGVAIAEKYNLPEIVKEFIYTHHGTTCTAYFYNKYINEGGNPDDAADFFYKGRKPHTKEQIIIMLSDTLEAASRSLKDYSPESISSLVEKMVKSKMNAGQFEDADISLKELNIVKAVLKSYLQQIYHARVAYPKRMHAATQGANGSL